MRNHSPTLSRTRRLRHYAAFTLAETVIAIGVLTVLLTGFIAVFTPAAQGIRRAITSEQADRLTTTLEREMVTLRDGQEPADAATGFDKAFQWLQEGNTADNAIFVYQYRGDPATIRDDGTPTPLPKIEGEPGKDFIVQSMVRRLDDGRFEEDLKAIEGALFYVKPTQLVYEGGELAPGTPGEIQHTLPGEANPVEADNATDYRDAVIAFSAEFHSIPTKSFEYLEGDDFGERFNNAKKPIFTRNLAVRR
jgi:hypothetical protein